ncbi:hypothetical protein DV735_g414, partial [Chaetothyriales sp. CBS 134920]
MRLLKFDERGELTHTKDLVDDIPPYAILSHTWGADEDEVLLHEVGKGIDRTKAGYTKIRFCGEQARKDGLDYFWVDTCCIDKTNSVELSGAINSMFKWYRNAVKCYVFLSDVSKHPRNGHDTQSQLRQSRWFTRGWTLQELVAPSSVQFFSQEGDELGSKKSLMHELHEITKIDKAALEGSRPLADFSVETRMSWAEKRTTRHAEDKAYSLLGIFGVHIPLIYAEGEENAFRRLEEEIEKASLLARGIQVTQSLVKFYVSSGNQDAEVDRIVATLEHLSLIFQSLSSALEDRIFRLDEQDLIKQIGSQVVQCEESIQELKEEFEKFDEASASGFKSRKKTATGRQVKYPFRVSTLQRLDENITEIQRNISLALEVLALRDRKTIQDDVAATKSLLEAMRAGQLSSTIRDWLRAPDPSINHHSVCAQRHPGTGLWFVNGSIFTKWLTQANSFLWLTGLAGSGNQRADDFSDLTRLHDSYRDSSPPARILIQTLRDVIQKFRQVYILLDALDESPRYDQRVQVLDAIGTMRKWDIPGLHLLATSRDETDIRDSLHPTEDEAVILKNAGVNRDISNFISERLNTDPNLRKWYRYRERIQQALADRAKGVDDYLEECLRSLPQSLDETYERMLVSIDENLVKDARRILTLLCFSSRPLTVQELIDGIAVDLDEPAGLKIRRRLQSVDDIHDICPGLIDVSILAEDERYFDSNCDSLMDESDRDSFMNESTRTVRIAHFSVQEYLQSDRVKLPVFALKTGPSTKTSSGNFHWLILLPYSGIITTRSVEAQNRSLTA